MLLVRARPTSMISGHLVQLGVLALLLAGCANRPPLPPQAILLNDQGIRYLARGNLEPAEARFQLALEYNPRFVEALCNLALVELERGNFDRASQLLRRALRANENIAQPYHGLGVLAERRGDRTAAADHYRAALAVDPGFIPARLNLARLLFEAHHYYHAKDEFTKLTELCPDCREAQVGLAETLIQLGRRDEAETLIEMLAPRFPDYPPLEVLEARVELRRGQTESAVRRLTPLTAGGDATAALALSWLAVAELIRHRPRAAIGAAKRALALDTSSRVARHALEAALQQLDRPAHWPATRGRQSERESGRVPEATINEE